MEFEFVQFVTLLSNIFRARQQFCWWYIRGKQNMKRTLPVLAVLWALTFISMVPVSAQAMILFPVPLTDSFDGFNNMGWRIPIHEDQSVDPNDALFVSDDGASGNCHSGGCIHSEGQSHMIFTTPKNLDAGSFSVWAKVGSGVEPQQAYIQLCDGFCNRTLRFDVPFVTDGAWHQYYFAWNRAGDTASVCVLRDTLNTNRCVWQVALVGGDPSYTDRFDGLSLFAHVPNNDVYFDDLVDSPQPVFDEECTSDCYSNVLFLPGVEGSRLYETVQGDENALWEPSDDSDALKLQMDASGTSLHDVYTKEGAVLDEVCVYHICPNIYKSFIDDMDALEDAGAIKDWAPIAYDWRLSFNELLEGGVVDGNKISYSASTNDPYIIAKLKDLADSSKTGKVTIIAHSNGGLLAKALLARLGSDAPQYVDKVIFVATPQLGTPEAIASILHGTAGIPFVLSNEAARQVVQNMPDAYNLLPSYDYFTYVDDPVVSFDAVTLPEWASKYGDVVHSTERLQNFMTDPTRTTPAVADLDTPTVANDGLFTKAIAAHQLLDSWTPPEGIEVYAIAGWGNDTLAGIRYKKVVTNTCLREEFGMCALYGKGTELTFDPQMTIDGDGTVVAPSALWSNGASTTQYWVDLSKAGKDHKNILELKNIRDLIDSIIIKDTYSSLPEFITKNMPQAANKNRLHFVLHSPLTLGFLDSNGEYTGSTATTTLLNNPDIQYRRYGDVQTLSIPGEEAGSVIMRGVAAGSFTLDVAQTNGSDIIATTSFQGVPSATSTIATLSIVPTQAPTNSGVLQVDFDGDGKADTTLQAKQDALVLPDLLPPEATISADVAARDLAVFGVDETSSTTVQKTATTTVVTDAAGNKTTLSFQKTYSGKLLTYAKLASVQYGASAPVVLPTSFAYFWDAKQVLVSQTVVADKQFVIQALYDKAKNKTSIVVLQKNIPIKVQTVSGLAVIKLTTNKGQIVYGW